MLLPPGRHFTHFFFVFIHLAFPAGTQGTTTKGPAQPVFETATCQSVSVNYITHGLPQQCLRPRTESAENATSTSFTAQATVSGFQRSDGLDPVRYAASDAASSDTAEPSRSAALSLDSASTSIAATGSTPTPSATNSEEAQPEMEESPLDAALFLSFEEWKAQNLAKAGQSSESFTDRAAREPRKAPGSIYSALDSLGDESEINIDFGFHPAPEKTVQAVATPSSDHQPHPPEMPRSKDAGKTCKERFNYASFDCAATVHKTNREARSANSILVENKDTYMLNECHAKDKFFVVELCDDILVDTVVLANFEFFSSVFKSFRVSVSDRYPVKASGWKELGVFHAKNSRDVQVFLVENPLIWARYLKIEILSHYGNEHYCPLSLLRIHGTTMMEEFKHQEEAARGETEEDVPEEVVPEAVAAHLKEAFNTETTASVALDFENTNKNVLDTPASNTQVMGDTNLLQQSFVASYSTNDGLRSPSADGQPIFTPASIFLCPTSDQLSTPKGVPSTSLLPSQTPRSIQSISSSSSDSSDSGSTVTPSFTESSQQPTTSTEQSSVQSESSSKSIDLASHDAKPSQASPSQPPSPSPTTQESFFKMVHKRLAHLESNSTLSLQYIEDQSRILRDAFSKVEKSQLSKTDRFLETLNSTVVAELNKYRAEYDQLWQSTVIALESQRAHSEHEMIAISTRLTLLADEVVYQKRMNQLIVVLLFVTIGVVLFSRNDRLVAPLVHHLRTRSSMRVFDSPPASPPIPQSPRASHHRRSSSGSISSSNSPTAEYAPPTPPAEYSRTGSPVNSEKKSSPGPRQFSQFGPRLKVETRNRRWQRLPSPLGSGCDDEYDTSNDGSNNESETAGRRSGEGAHTVPRSFGEPGGAVYGEDYFTREKNREADPLMTA